MSEHVCIDADRLIKIVVTGKSVSVGASQDELRSSRVCATSSGAISTETLCLTSIFKNELHKPTGPNGTQTSHTPFTTFFNDPAGFRTDNYVRPLRVTPRGVRTRKPPTVGNSRESRFGEGVLRGQCVSR